MTLLVPEVDGGLQLSSTDISCKVWAFVTPLFTPSLQNTGLQTLSTIWRASSMTLLVPEVDGWLQLSSTDVSCKVWAFVTPLFVIISIAASILV
jgi:hypothetical protein